MHNYQLPTVINVSMFQLMLLKFAHLYCRLICRVVQVGSQTHSVTCRPTVVTFPPLLLQPKLVLDLVTPEGCKAELSGLW